MVCFDGEAQERGQFNGARGVIRVDKHTEYRWMIKCGSRMNINGELLGVWEFLTLATRLHIYDLHVFWDSRNTIDWLNQKGTLQVLYLTCWKDQIKALLKDFTTLVFYHTYRAFNREGNELSKNVFHQPEGKITYYQMEDGLVGMNVLFHKF